MEKRPEKLMKVAYLPTRYELKTYLKSGYNVSMKINGRLQNTCGIHSLDGLNNFIHMLTEEDFSFKEIAQTFIIACKKFQGHSAFFIASPTRFPGSEEFIDALKEYSGVIISEWSKNPNSRNHICSIVVDIKKAKKNENDIIADANSTEKL